MYLVLILIAVIWVAQRNKGAVTSAATLTGGWHGPPQTAIMDGQNLDGNAFDNGTTQPILKSQWSGYDPPIGNIVFAVAGGEDGQNPAQPSVTIPTTQVVTTGRFQILGGGAPTRPPVVPVQVNSLNDVVRR